MAITQLLVGGALIGKGDLACGARLPRDSIESYVADVLPVRKEVPGAGFEPALHVSGREV